MTESARTVLVIFVVVIGLAGFAACIIATVVSAAVDQIARNEDDG